MDDSPTTLEKGSDSPHAPKKLAPVFAGSCGMKFSYPSGSTPLEGFTIKRGIGVGGFGEVYFAISDAGKEVALKKIQRNLDIELRGVRQCLNLKHVNLISLWDIRTNEFGESWVVMEYVPGPSLRDLVERHPTGMPEEQIKTWFASTASGVAYLHEHGIVHRDLKPGNIFCDEHEQVIKIGDYGLSKFISCSRQSGHTESVGTFHYMAPEIGKGVYGKEIDIYALGIILYEMLTGTVPFNGESTQEIIMKHLTTDPNVDIVPEGFRDVISKAMRKDSTQRFRNVPDMVAQLPWPDIASMSQRIISQHSVGPMFVGKSPEATPTGATDQPTNPHPGIQPDTDQASIQATVSKKLPPVIIDGSEPHGVPEIVFGPLRDSNHPNGLLDSEYATPARKKTAAEIDPIRIVEPRVAPASDMALTSESELAPKPSREPIARALTSAALCTQEWLNKTKLSTPAKMALLIIGGIVVIKNSAWLLPVTFGLGVLYLVYYLAFTFFFSPQTKTELSGWQSNDEAGSAIRVRAWLRDRPASDRATELIGSLLVAAFACIVLNLLGLALGNGILESSVEIWSYFTWLTLVSIATCWCVLGLSKNWSLSDTNDWTRRVFMGVLGLVIGAVAFFSAGSFGIDLTRTALIDFQTRHTDTWVFRGIPMLPAYLIFFAGLFGMLRWWKQVDPIRRTRLSMWYVFLGLIWATLFSHLLNVPLSGSCILAVVVSVSIQLASPWIHPNDRQAICAD